MFSERVFINVYAPAQQLYIRAGVSLVASDVRAGIAALGCTIEIPIHY